MKRELQHVYESIVLQRAVVAHAFNNWWSFFTIQGSSRNRIAGHRNCIQAPNSRIKWNHCMYSIIWVTTLRCWHPCDITVYPQTTIENQEAWLYDSYTILHIDHPSHRQKANIWLRHFSKHALTWADLIHALNQSNEGVRDSLIMALQTQKIQKLLDSICLLMVLAYICFSIPLNTYSRIQFLLSTSELSFHNLPVTQPLRHKWKGILENQVVIAVGKIRIHTTIFEVVRTVEIVMTHAPCTPAPRSDQLATWLEFHVLRPSPRPSLTVGDLYHTTTTT